MGIPESKSFVHYCIVGEGSLTTNKEILVRKGPYESFSEVPHYVVDACKNILSQDNTVHDTFDELEDDQKLLLVNNLKENHKAELRKMKYTRVRKVKLIAAYDENNKLKIFGYTKFDEMNVVEKIDSKLNGISWLRKNDMKKFTDIEYYSEVWVASCREIKKHEKPLVYVFCDHVNAVHDIDELGEFDGDIACIPTNMKRKKKLRNLRRTLKCMRNVWEIAQPCFL